uniref:Uncharacterized protein n=1 Tax=Rhizophora mucronata TaxID=61149 RepID=A0A2P2KWM3_RHIMU
MHIHVLVNKVIFRREERVTGRITAGRMLVEWRRSKEEEGDEHEVLILNVERAKAIPIKGELMGLIHFRPMSNFCCFDS